MVSITLPSWDDPIEKGPAVRKLLRSLIDAEPWDSENLVAAVDEWLQIGAGDELAEAVLEVDEAAQRQRRDTIYHEAAKRLEAFESSLSGARDVNAFTFGDLHLWVTGGTTWGDSPSESYDVWNLLFFDTDYSGCPWGDELYHAYGFIENIPRPTPVEEAVR